MRVLSPSTEPPLTELDGSTASTATRWPCADQVQAERLDQRRLADAGRARDAHAQRLARVRQELRHHVARERLVVGARRLGERDGLGEQPAVGGAHARDEPLLASSRAACRLRKGSSALRRRRSSLDRRPSRSADLRQHVGGAHGNRGARTVDAGHAGRLQHRDSPAAAPRRRRTRRCRARPACAARR